MKKVLIVAISVGCFLLLSVYIFIPAKLDINKIDYVGCNVNGAYRVLSHKSTWSRWWPKDEPNSGLQMDSSASIFSYNGFKYQLSQKYYNAIEVKLTTKHSTIESQISLLKMNLDSVVLIWNCELPTSSNPITRVLKYNEAENIRNNMKDILANLRSYLQDQKNIYGINLHVEMSKDSTMVLTKSFTKKYPNTSDIYQLIGNLKKYIAAEEAKENNFPMLNIKKLPDSTFETMVAIPVNRELPGNKTISFSRFVPWKVLTAEVKGGDATVDESLLQMKIYISDYQKTAMAIPFESLVTDRSKDPDTSKWITRIYTAVP